MFFAQFKLNDVKVGVVERFLLELMLDEGKSTSEIARALGITPRMVQYLKKRPLIMQDEEEKVVREFVERHPFLPPAEIASRLKVSLYKVYKVLKRLLDVPNQTQDDIRGIELARELIERGDISRAARLISMITLMPRDHDVLMKIPDELLPPSYRLSKFRYRMVNWGEDFRSLEAELLQYLEELAEKGLTLYYYQGQILRLSILNMQGKFHQVLEFYTRHRREVLRLPYGIRINLIAPVVEASVNLSQRGVYSYLLRYLEERVRSDTFENSWHRAITRQVFFSALNHLGIFNRINLLREDDNPVILALHYLGSGSYERVVRIGLPPNNRLYQFYIVLLRNIARLMLGWEEEPLSDYMDMAESSSISKAYVYRYRILRHAKEGDMEMAYGEMKEVISILGEGIVRRIYVALLNGDASVLKSSPREVLLKYLFRQDIGRAVSYAEKMKMIFPLQEYVLLKPPSSIRAYNYQVLRPVLPRPTGYLKGNRLEVGSRKIRLGRSRVDGIFLELVRKGRVDRKSLSYDLIYRLKKKFFPLVEVRGNSINLYGNVVQL